MFKLSRIRVDSSQFSPAGPRTIGRMLANRNASKKASNEEKDRVGTARLHLNVNVHPVGRPDSARMRAVCHEMLEIVIGRSNSLLQSAKTRTVADVHAVARSNGARRLVSVRPAAGSGCGGAAQALRTGRAGSQDELRCGAIRRMVRRGASMSPFDKPPFDKPPQKPAKSRVHRSVQQ